VQFVELFSWRETGVRGAGHRKDNAINTAQFVHASCGKGNTVLMVIYFPVQDSGSQTHDTGKTIGGAG
jgi:hypothetical protein